LATAPDVTNMPHAALQEPETAASKENATKCDEELKVLADGYVKKAAAGFSIENAVEVLTPYWTIGWLQGLGAVVGKLESFVGK
jgi:DNA-binding protein H-NS